MDTDSNVHPLNHRKDRILGSLLAGPHDPLRPFLAEGLTFGQLYDRASAIGQSFRNLPDATGLVCLCSEDRATVAAALVAALMEGVPLLIPFAFDDATVSSARKRMPFHHALVEGEVSLPAGVKELTWTQSKESKAEAAPQKPLAWDQPWLYLFTGGSTGTPQIWSKTPRNLLLEALYLVDTFRIGSDDTIVATVPTNHIYGLLYSILVPLVSGATVEAVTPSFPHEIEERLVSNGATILVSIPAHYRALKETPIENHRVRLAFSSAGALPEQDAAQFHKTTGIAVTEIYGSTETGGIAQRTRAQAQTSLSPFDCVDIRIENQHLQVRSPFLSDELARDVSEFFETADRAQWSNRPGFTLLGRSDGIVKVGGKRADLALTKQALLEVEGVRDVYVYAHPVQSGRENEIMALVEGSATPDQLVEAANTKLPIHARPRNIKVASKMPLTSTGKYRRTAIEDFFKR